MSERRSNPKRTRARVELATGVGLVLFGIIATLVTYNEAVEAGGGTYLVVYGPIVGGLLSLVRGVIDLFHVEGFGRRKRSQREVVTLELVVGSVLTVLAIIVALTTFGGTSWGTGLFGTVGLALTI